MSKYITIETASRESGFSECQIHALLINKKVRFKYSKPIILIDQDSLNEYIEENWGLAEVMRKPSKSDLLFFIAMGVNIDNEGKIFKVPIHP